MRVEVDVDEEKLCSPLVSLQEPETAQRDEVTEWYKYKFLQESKIKNTFFTSSLTSINCN